MSLSNSTLWCHSLDELGELDDLDELDEFMNWMDWISLCCICHWVCSLFAENDARTEIKRGCFWVWCNCRGDQRQYEVNLGKGEIYYSTTTHYNLIPFNTLQLHSILNANPSWNRLLSRCSELFMSNLMLDCAGGGGEWDLWGPWRPDECTSGNFFLKL